MKRLVLTIVAIAASSSIYCQTWSGSTTGTGNAYRSGNVGIGTTTIPGAALHLQTTGSLPFMIERTASGAHNNNLTIAFTSSPGAGITIGSGSTIFKASNPNNVSDMLFMPTPTAHAMIIKPNTFVGIGTTSPLAKLHVDQGAIRITGNNPYGGPMVLFGGSATTAPSGEWGIEYANGLNFWKPYNSTGGFGNYFLFLANSGKVGINTNNPTAQFTVNGNVLIGDPGSVSVSSANYKLFVQTGILTEKVKVALKSTTDWADYVFAPDYTLPSLTEVKTFISENKHLKGIPSAQELVDAQGYDLSKMDAKLLEKIEELTLYMIQLSDENKELKARINTLENNK